MLTRLINGEHEGRKLTETELLQNCIFILNAGHETTTNLIGNALYTFLRYPDQMQRVMDDPVADEIAVEEVLRFESSNQLGNRRVVADTMLGGVAMKEGDLITICIGGANRDPKYFPDPDRFDVGRQSQPASRLCQRHPCLRRHECGAAGRPHRTRAFPEEISGLSAGRRARALAARALSRVHRAAGDIGLGAICRMRI